MKKIVPNRKNFSMPVYCRRGLTLVIRQLIVLLLLLPLGLSAQQQVVEFTSSGTWIAPCGATNVSVQVWGAGGGGGNASSVLSWGRAAGGGGGGGAFNYSNSITVTPGQSYNIVVGQGGGANADGGSSSALGLTAQGGKRGGNVSSVFGSNPTGTGGAGGAAPSYKGGNGANGNVGSSYAGGGGSSAGTAANGVNAANGNGATAPTGGGNGGNGGNNSDGSGNAGTWPGGGGGGAISDPSFYQSANGGEGASGRVLITYTGMPSINCIPSFSQVHQITKVEFAGINKTTTSNAGWEQICDQTGTVNRGGTYPISVTIPNVTGNGNTHYFNAFFDWNNNGEFEASEEVQIGWGFGTGISGNITIPEDASLGFIRMRIFGRRSGFATPCQVSTNGNTRGQAEDYFIEVNQQPVCTTPNPASNLTLQYLTNAPGRRIEGSFTAAAGGASGYLVIQTTGNVPPLAPTNGVSYALGSNALGGTVISNNTATNFTTTNIFGNETYCFWIYSFNTGCIGAPYYSLTSISNCQFVPFCEEYATMSISGNSSTIDWTNANNWSPKVVPGPCTNVTINYTADSGGDADSLVLNLPVNANIKSLTINGKFSNAGGIYVPGSSSSQRRKVFTFNNNGNTLNIQDDLIITASGSTDQLSSGNTLNSHKVIFNFTGSSVLNVYGNTIIGDVLDNQLVNFGSTAGTPTFYFWGNVSFNRYANSLPNGTYVFEQAGAGAQTLTNNISNNNTRLRLQFQHAKVGEAGNSYPSLTVTGSAKTGIAGGNLAVKNGASLLLEEGTGLSQHRAAATGTFTLAANASLELRGNSSSVSYIDGTFPGIAGSNMPAQFANYQIDAASTVKYNSGNAVNQTVTPLPGTAFGNLSLGNASGAGNTTKSLSNNISIAGNLAVNSFTTYDMGAFTGNRTGLGGSLTLDENATLLLGGNAGGEASGSNFPANFASKLLHSGSTVNYNRNGNQSIYEAEYGNLTLSNAGNKTAPASLNLRGNLTGEGAAQFVHNNGEVNFNGFGNAQSYSASNPFSFYKLNNFNSNANGLTTMSDLSVIDELTLGNSSKLMLNANTKLVLKSSVSKTASVAQVPSSASIVYGTNAGFEVERYLTNYKAWRFIAAPVKAAGSASFAASWGENGVNTPGYGTVITGPSPGFVAPYVSGHSVKWWDGNAGTGGSYVTVNSPSDAIARKEGYMVFVRGDLSILPTSTGSTATNLRIKGEILTGNQPYSINGGRFLSIGNPYPAPISAEKVLQAAGNAVSTPVAAYYAWDPSIAGTYFVGGYQTLTSIDGFEALAGGSALYPLGSLHPNIQSGQAIFIQNPSAGTMNFNITEDMKVAGSGGPALSRTVNTMSDREFIRTKLFTAADVVADGNLVAFDDEFTNELDGDDAVKFMNGGENFGMMRAGKRLAVEARERIAVTDTIFYHMTNIKATDYKLVIAPKNIQNIAITAFLVDRFLNKHTPVSLTDSTVINFSGTSNTASRAADRFMLVFAKPAVVLPVTIVSVSATRNNDRSIAVRWKVENELNMLKYEVERSKDGRNFSSILSTDPTAVNGGSASYLQTDLSPLASDNFYRIKAISLNGQVQYSAIVQVASAPIAAAITVFPNPVTDKQMNVSFSGQQKGDYIVELIAVNGQVVHKTRVVVSSNNVTEQIQLGRNIAAGRYQLRVTAMADGSISTQSLFVK